jgi:hypothetical protein
VGSWVGELLLDLQRFLGNSGGSESHGKGYQHCTWWHGVTLFVVDRLHGLTRGGRTRGQGWWTSAGVEDAVAAAGMLEQAGAAAAQCRDPWAAQIQVQYEAGVALR